HERGVQFSGGSAVIEPDGTVRARLDTGDGIVFGEVDLERARAKRHPGANLPDKLAARRPDLYDTLTLQPYLWNPLEFHGLYGHRPLPPGRRSRVAVLQFRPRPGDPTANLAAIEQALAARPRGTRLVVSPEYALTGVPYDAREAARLALAANEASEHVHRLARRHRLVLVAGFLERLADGYASSAVVVGPDGLLAHYRKTHVIGRERSFLAPGADRPPVLELPIGRVGLLIGSDLCFPEIVRALALDGCDLILAPAGPLVPPVQPLGPTAVPLPAPAVTGDDPTHFHLARVRAFENASYLAYAALPAPEGSGWSGVFGPEPATRATEELVAPAAVGVASALVDTANRHDRFPTNPVRAKELLRLRQPHLYTLLQLPIDGVFTAGSMAPGVVPAW
ncbi:MAG: nitrilase/cyanide hydratase and apolipoprotein N-acyltransferase, partial [Thermomicrobium sp.]|nr:nitrilase/cyanide hydratase and apolipoprotein N-acyltransferase [Thermomicrobium sp.]